MAGSGYHRARLPPAVPPPAGQRSEFHGLSLSPTWSLNDGSGAAYASLLFAGPGLSPGSTVTVSVGCQWGRGRPRTPGRAGRTLACQCGCVIQPRFWGPLQCIVQELKKKPTRLLAKGKRKRKGGLRISSRRSFGELSNGRRSVLAMQASRCHPYLRPFAMVSLSLRIRPLCCSPGGLFETAE